MRHLVFSEEVRTALDEKRPIVALESTIIAHGMPFPRNVETAFLVEKTIRDAGAVPATCAILQGKLRAGLSAAEIEFLGKEGAQIPKASRRDLPYLLSKGLHGATTVASTMIVAHLAGIRIFATGGIGGVHRGAATTMDISADLEELDSAELGDGSFTIDLTEFDDPDTGAVVALDIEMGSGRLDIVVPEGTQLTGSVTAVGRRGTVVVRAPGSSTGPGPLAVTIADASGPSGSRTPASGSLRKGETGKLRKVSVSVGIANGLVCFRDPAGSDQCK